MRTTDYIYHHNGLALHGYLACEHPFDGLRPAVLVVHDWAGRNEFACKKADLLAKSGYLGFAVDMYGEGRIGETIEEKQALMQPLVSNRALLRARIGVALDAVKAIEGVDKRRIAVMGFCFGGLCALDLARSGADLVGAISFHGLLNKADNLPNHIIKSKILALHGYDDPMVKPADVHEFCQEMNEAGVDWQMNMFGLTQHAYTNPAVHNKQLGLMYNAEAARRSFQAMDCFLKEVFE